MKPIVFTDLDDTLFQTARKMAVAPDEAHLASVALNGSHSYTTSAQAAMVTWLLETTEVIPVTARTSEALARVRIGFHGRKVCANGAVILNADGTPDRAWLARSQQRAAGAAGAMAQMQQFVESDPRFRSWIATEFETGIYFCVKSNGAADDLDLVDGPLTAQAGLSFTRHRNGNNLSFTPVGISKKDAVAYLIDTLPQAAERPIFGFGDSLTDLPFMELCTMMVIPSTSQIHKTRLEGAAA